RLKKNRNKTPIRIHPTQRLKIQKLIIRPIPSKIQTTAAIELQIRLTQIRLTQTHPNPFPAPNPPTLPIKKIRKRQVPKTLTRQLTTPNQATKKKFRLT